MFLRDFILVGIFRLVYYWLCLVVKKVQEYTRKLKKLRIFLKSFSLFFKKINFSILVFGLTWLFLMLLKCLYGLLNVKYLII